MAWYLDQVVYKELVVSDTFASAPSAWVRAQQFTYEDKVQTAHILTRFGE